MNRNATNLTEFCKPAPVRGGLALNGYWVWCGSVAKGEDGRWHMFASRWPKTLPFHPGWGLASEIVRAVSDTPEGPYTFAEVVLPARGAGWWDGRATHNPVIAKTETGWALFYTGITHPFPEPEPDERITHDSYQWLAARASKRIGLATAPSILGPWQRPDAPLLNPRPGHFDDFFTSNPAPCINPDGSCLLVYKTRQWRPPPYTGITGNEMYGSMTLGAAYAPHWAGPYTRLSDKPLFDADNVVEDPFVWYTDNGYAMLAKDWGGRHSGDVGSLVLAQSRDGAHWTVLPGTALQRDILWDDGVRRVMGNLDRPFLLFDASGNATHLFAATNDGSEAGFSTLTRSWNACIPLL